MTLCSEGVEIVDASCEQRFSLQEKNAHKVNGEDEDGRTTNIVRVRHGFANYRSSRNSATYGGFSRSRQVSGVCLGHHGDAYTASSIQWQVCLYAQDVQRLPKEACGIVLGTWCAKSTLQAYIPRFSFQLP